ncbi:MAG: hypothetical protein QW275_00555 [Candidatus Anstonellaceae archaeon]
MRFSFAFAVLLFLCYSFAQNASAPAQEHGQGIPPSVPDVRNILSIQAIFSNGTPASQVPIAILARANKSETIFRSITDSSGKFLLSLQNGDYQFDALIDLPSTTGVDFASTGEISVPNEGNLTIFFYPSGSLYGQAINSQSPVPLASAKVSCPSAAFDYSRINGGEFVRSDESGIFLFRALPVGSCIVSVYDSNLAGSSEVKILHGNVTYVIVDMKKKSKQEDFMFPLLIAAIGALVAWQLFLRNPHTLSQGKPPSQALAKKEKASNAPKANLQNASEGQKLDASNPKVSAVLATLSEREREIMLFLLKSGGRAKRSQIQHKLLIPKTSLLRNLRSLERKNIIYLTPFGRNLLAEINQSIFK